MGLSPLHYTVGNEKKFFPSALTQKKKPNKKKNLIWRFRSGMCLEVHSTGIQLHEAFHLTFSK